MIGSDKKPFLCQVAAPCPNGCSLNVQNLYTYFDANLFPVQSLQVECDEYCIRVLKARQTEGVLSDAPIWTDVTTYEPTGSDLAATVVAAGFPCQVGIRSKSFTVLHSALCCQGVSGAGKQLGLLDGRSSLVKEPFRVFDRLPLASES